MPSVRKRSEQRAGETLLPSGGLWVRRNQSIYSFEGRFWFLLLMVLMYLPSYLLKLKSHEPLALLFGHRPLMIVSTNQGLLYVLRRTRVAQNGADTFLVWRNI